MITVTVTARRTDHPDRWVRMALTARDRSDNGGRSGPYGVVAYPTEFKPSIQPADELAKSYSRENWESGLVSAVLLFLRHGHQSLQVFVTEFVGRLASEDMGGIVSAATVGVGTLLGQPRPPAPGWEVTVDQNQPVSPSAP